MAPDPTVEQVVKWILKGIGYTAAVCGSLMVIALFLRRSKEWLKPQAPHDCENCPALIKYKMQQDEAMTHRTVTDQARSEKQEKMIDNLIEKLTRPKP